uniref:RING-type domain-containing protein n=1 Tax=Prymnesium polylepis TaxID=72548 RepID=A0A6T8BWT1_9EUKA
MNRDFGEADYEMLLQLDEESGREKKSKLRENSKRIDQLPSHRATKSELASKEEPTCAICLENIRAQQNVTTLPCKHEYHRQCIAKWLKMAEAASCPQCKAPALDVQLQGGGASAEAGAVTTADSWWHT